MNEGCFVSKTYVFWQFFKNQRPSLVGQKAHGVRVQLDSTLRNETLCERGLLFAELLCVVYFVYQKDPERFHHIYRQRKASTRFRSPCVIVKEITSSYTDDCTT